MTGDDTSSIKAGDEGRSLTGRLLAFDVDGTLFDSRGAVSERTVAAIDAAAAVGAICVLATGRDWSGVRALLARIQGLSHALCVNGIEVLDRHGVELHAEELPYDVVFEVIDILRATLPDVAIGAGLAGGTVGEAGILQLFTDDVIEFDLVDDVATAIRPGVRDLMLWHPVLSADLERFHVVCSEALHVDGIDVAFTGMPMIEIVPEGCGKDTGLAWLARHLGIQRGDVVAFGDGLNDLAMLRWAGHGVAMGQAAIEVRTVADEVTATNDDDGVAHWLEARL